MPERGRNWRRALAAFGGGCVVVSGVVIWKAASFDPVTQAAAADALEDVKVVDGELQRYVLAARFGLLQQYDPLVTKSRELAAATARARGAIQRLDGAAAPQPELRALDAAVNARLAAVERFKPANATLANSLRFLPSALRAETRAVEANGPREQWLAGACLLGELALTENVGVSDAGAQFESLAATLDKTAAAFPAATVQQTELLVRHARLIDSGARAMRPLMATLTDNSVEDAVHRLRAAHDVEATPGEESAARWRWAQWAWVAVLLALVIAGGKKLVDLYVTLERRVAERTQELRATLEEQRRMEIELRQAQKLSAVGQLAAGVAHELNTPIQYVSDNTLFLKRSFEKLVATAVGYQSAAQTGVGMEAADQAAARARLPYLADEVPKAIDQSMEGLRRVASIVTALKGFSHPSRGEKTMVSLREAAETTSTVARNEWKYVADLDLDIADDLPLVPALRDELNQVILNLVVNAAHAIEEKSAGTERRGRITISARVAGDDAELSVTDDGAGISDEVRQHVFEPFFTTKPVGKGTGQGLAMVYAVVVKKHGGVVRLDSEPGRGTTVTISLPLGERGGPDDVDATPAPAAAA